MTRKDVVTVPSKRLIGMARQTFTNQYHAIYPIRIGDYGPYKAVNYHRWDVCKAAVLLGKKENVAVYQFLKEPLIRKFGEKWYQELEVAVKELKAHDMI